jgi:thiol-disulfide isomerase/thioredoxin
MNPKHRLKLSAAGLAAGLLFAGCSSASSLTEADSPAETAGLETPMSHSGESAQSTDPTESDPSEAAAAPIGTGIVPTVDVIDVNTEASVNLGSVVPSDTPVLLWAWAPHCPSCRAEAPELQEFAAANLDKVTVVGIGTQDDLPYAKEFIADTGVTTPQMLWDPTFITWQQLGITAQPTWVLVDGNGEQLGRWVGALPTDQILSLV